MKFDIEDEKLILDVDGEEVSYDVLFTFDSEDTMKSYVGYTDHSFAENGRKNIYFSAYNPLSPKMELEEVTDEREIAMLNVYHILLVFIMMQ